MNRSYARLFAAILTFLSALFAHTRPATAALRTVAVANQIAPGTSESFLSLATPTINDAGHVAFAGAVPSGVGLWSEASQQQLILVALEGQTAPGPSSFGFRDLNVIVSDGPYSAFMGEINWRPTGFQYERGIWRESVDGVELLVRENLPIEDPSTNELISLDNIVGMVPVLNRHGQIAFSSFLNPGLFENLAVLSSGSGTLQIVARDGDPAPGLDPGVVIDRPGTVVLNDVGRVAFLSSLSGTGIDSSNSTAIWAETSDSVRLVARAGDNAPGTTSVFRAFGSGGCCGRYGPVLNNAGEIAFWSYINGGGAESDNNSGIWSESGGVLRLVARAGDHAPGTSSDEQFGTFRGAKPLINSQGKLGFTRQLTSGKVGIWVDDSASLELLVLEGELPVEPDVPSDAYLGEPHLIAMNAVGQVAFRLHESGVGVSSLWATSLSGEPGIIAFVGQSIEVMPNDFRTVQAIVTSNDADFSGGEDGQINIMNEFGQIAFRANFTDGSSAVLVSDKVATDPFSGDFDLDGDVDGFDFLEWQQSAGGHEFSDWNSDYGSKLGGSIASHSVPEPSTASIVSISFAIYLVHFKQFSF